MNFEFRIGIFLVQINRVECKRASTKRTCIIFFASLYYVDFLFEQAWKIQVGTKTHHKKSQIKNNQFPVNTNATSDIN